MSPSCVQRGLVLLVAPVELSVVPQKVVWGACAHPVSYDGAADGAAAACQTSHATAGAAAVPAEPKNNRTSSDDCEFTGSKSTPVVIVNIIHNTLSQTDWLEFALAFVTWPDF